MFLDTIFIPAFIGFYASSLISLLMIAVILYLGINEQSISIGFLFALLVEYVFKYTPGSYAITFLLIALVIFLISRFLNLPSLKSSRNIVDIVSLSVVAPFINYLFHLVFTGISAYTKDGYSFLLPAHDLILLVYYSVGMFLILIFLKLLDTRHVQERI